MLGWHGRFNRTIAGKSVKETASNGQVEGGNMEDGASQLTEVKLSTLLMKEQEEVNTWLRTSLQIYYAWYTVFLTLNGAGLALVFQYQGQDKPGAKLVFLIFALWNLLGIAASVTVFLYVRQSRNRVDTIYKHLLIGVDHAITPRAPMPTSAALITIILNVVAMSSLLAVWTRFMFIHPPPQPAVTIQQPVAK
jgi:hypothetical protein